MASAVFKQLIGPQSVDFAITGRLIANQTDFLDENLILVRGNHVEVYGLNRGDQRLTLLAEHDFHGHIEGIGFV